MYAEFHSKIPLSILIITFVVWKKIKNYFFDLNDYKYLSKVINNFKPDIIFHLAAQSLVIEGIKNPSYTFNNNINTTINILEILKIFKIFHLLL